MGSARVTTKPTEPLPMENSDKKSIKTLIKSLFHKKKDKGKCEKKEEHNIKVEKVPETKTCQPNDAVAAVLESFNKLNLKPKANKCQEQEMKDPELDNFEIKVVEEHRNERIHSNSSEDSGYSDTKEELEITNKTENVELENADKCDDIVEGLEKISLEEKKKKKLQVVVVSRGPIRSKLCDYSSYPYPAQDLDSCRQISQINKHTLTGGQVIVNSQDININEFQQALDDVQQNAQLQTDQETYFKDLLEYINEDTTKAVQESLNQEFDMQEKTYTNFLQENLQHETINEDIFEYVQKELNSIPNEMTRDYITTDYNISTDYQVPSEYTYPTPPRSETALSPMNFSPGSLYPSNSEYILSPERSPISNTDYEKYQEIPHFEDESIDKTRERTSSSSSMTMKQYKDLQKDIVHNLSKKDCCQTNRKSCKELFQEHLQKLEMTERKSLCLSLSKMDLKTAYGVLHNIMLSISKGSKQEDLEMVLFEMICDRLLAHDISLFVGDVGLSLLKAASLRCPHKPLLTRYLVECIRTAVKCKPELVQGKEYLFHEVDTLGDNLIIACARAGDRCADVLCELVRGGAGGAGEPALFRHTHANADGYTALHVACSQHSGAAPRLHVVHVLLEHARFDITHPDLKGRDTALHLAVYSSNCDLQLILLMFKHVDRKEWKGLAHCANLSSKSPLDLARMANKSATRQNYPPEVLEFLKKCR